MTVTAYISRDDAEAYFADFAESPPAAWSSASTDQKTLALRVATRWIDIQFAGRWKGIKTSVAIAQGTAWPRSGVYDRDGLSVDDSVTPDAVRFACAEAAALHLAGSLDNLPTVVATSARVRQKSISAGGVSKSVQYVGGVSESPAMNRSFPLIVGLLSDLLSDDSAVRHVFA